MRLCNANADWGGPCVTRRRRLRLWFYDGLSRQEIQARVWSGLFGLVWESPEVTAG